MDAPKYIPMKPEQIVKLSPEDRQEYEKSLEIKKDSIIVLENIIVSEVDRCKNDLRNKCSVILK